VAVGAEPPAVVSLLARRLEQDGFGVTLADLAARSWFRLSGIPGPGGPVMCPVMCTVPAETPAEPLAPYERRVMAHVARRAGVRGEVPAPALSDSFEGGREAFMKAFRDEVTADAERRGLRRPRLSGRRIGLLCLVLAAERGRAGGAGPVARGGRRRASGLVRPGRGDTRLQAYAAALGRAPGVVAVFDAAGQNTVWSSYRDSWQQLPVETRGGAWPLALRLPELADRSG
jgi:hypothetical protein